MQLEARTEKIGSELGSTILKVKVKDSGLKVRGSGTPWEMINIAAILLDNVAVETQSQLVDVVGALAEILADQESKAI